MVSALEACDTGQKKSEKAVAAPLVLRQTGSRGAERMPWARPRVPSRSALPAPLRARGPQPASGQLRCPAARGWPSLGGSGHCGGSARPVVSGWSALLSAPFLLQASVLAPGLLDLNCCSWIFSWSRWGLVSPPGIEPMRPALGAHSLSHWTTREVPDLIQP